MFIPCKCGCGCGHSCERVFGPYFHRTVRKGKKVTSQYLGGFLQAAEELCGFKSGQAFQEKMSQLMEVAIKRTRVLEAAGHKVADPGERGHAHGRSAALAKPTDKYNEQFLKRLGRR